MKDRGAAEGSLWHGCGGEKQGLGLVFLKLQRDAIIPCKHIMMLNSGATGKEKLSKSNNIIHIETTKNTLQLNFIKCFSFSVH